jgi:[acyl-carrier-protein] S-malonyltransferase/trans-AT polyketide synthase/acyltransferase/oxidoreductase domain-containing protein
MLNIDAPLRGSAVVFPGQGSQRPGMAEDFRTRFSAAREVFEEASDALGLDAVALCAGQDGKLDLTEFAQPAILTAEIAVFRTLEREFDLRASYFGGHSLGEYTALCAAGVIPLADAVRIVRARGAAMQRAVPVGLGGMLAVSGPDVEQVRETTRARFDLDVASINSPDQIVLSGLSSHVARAEAELGQEGFLVSRLDVSAPFHSRFMKTIESTLRRELEANLARWDTTHSSSVVSNTLAAFHGVDPQAIVAALVLQLSAPVRWLENMDQLGKLAERIVEIGPSRPLRGLFRSLGREVASVTTVRCAERELRA